MSTQTELTCVSCGTDFDPEETGGFCPDCDTPHPDFERDEAADEDAVSEADAEPADDEDAGADADAEPDATDDADAETEAEAEADEADAEPAVDETDDATAEPDPADVDDEAEADEEPDDPEPAETIECASCGNDVDPDFEFCPSCGDDLKAAGEPVELDVCPDCSEDVDEGMSFCPNCGHDLEAARQPGDADGAPEEVTLVVNGESYSFGDGDTFGRQDEDWLPDLVEASGGRDEVAYISSEHLTFSVDEDGVHVSDTSANGTTLNGDDMDGETETLADGDVLTLADRAEIHVEL